MTSQPPRTLYEKIWNAHTVARLDGEEWLIYVDRHLVYEVTSPQAFEGLRLAGRTVRRPDLTFAVADHNVPTEKRAGGLAAISDPDSRLQVETLEKNAREFGIPYAPLTGPNHGIVHVVGPELGLSLPGAVIVCGDSHTSTHGAFGALAFGIGTSEAEHVLATQTLIQKQSRTMLVRIDGALGVGITPKDVVLAMIGKIGTAGATGHVIEYAGETITAMDMAGRMTICNMAIEAGARAGMIAPDETTFRWLEGRPCAPTGEHFETAKAHWRGLFTDPGATYDRTVTLRAEEIAPMVSWGTSPESVTTIAGHVPDPATESDAQRRAQAERMLAYMDL